MVLNFVGETSWSGGESSSPPLDDSGRERKRRGRKRKEEKRKLRDISVSQVNSHQNLEVIRPDFVT